MQEQERQGAAPGVTPVTPPPAPQPGNP
jgi:hypothetical protein